MPTDEQNGAVTDAETLTTTPTPESTVQPEPTEALETSTPGTDAEPKTYKSWREALADADPEELLKDDRIAGRIGQVADKRARELAAQQKAADDLRKQQEADRAEDRRLRELRSQNPVAYATEMERKDASADAIAEEARRQASMAGDVTGELSTYVRENFPKEVVDSLAGKTYEGSYAQGVKQYFADLDKANRAHLRSQWEKDERPALRKQILAELNGGEPPIDSSQAEARPGKKFNSNLQASTALMNGEITLQEYTRQAYQNGWR